MRIPIKRNRHFPGSCADKRKAECSMSEWRKLPYGIKEEMAPGRHHPPFIVIIGIFLCTLIAGLGEWKVINNALGGLPKICSLGVIGIAFVYFLCKADFGEVRRALSYLPMYLLLIAALMLCSLAIWVFNMTDQSSMMRGLSKMLYQVFTILYAVSFVYLCGEKSIDYFFYCMVAVNGLIALLEVPGYGVAASIQSVITCIVTYGNADGYVRALEIHDITFLFGQFLVYYMAFAPKETKKEHWAAWGKAFAALFFMLLGLKRLALPAAVLMGVVGMILVRSRHPFRWAMTFGIGLTALFWFYLYVVHSGLLTVFLKTFGVDMMGRDYIWSLANSYYEFSGTFPGLGFEAVDAIVSEWYHTGLLNHPYPFHNDVLKVFVEMGFGGFCLWTGIQYLYYPWFWNKRFGGKAALFYMLVLAYMSITYMTDNTAFYYWSSIGLRLLPMCFSYGVNKKQKKPAWKAPTAEDVADAVWILVQKKRENR